VTDGDGSECLLNKAFEQGDSLTSTLGKKIINEIEQLELDSSPDPRLKTAPDSSAYSTILTLGLELQKRGQHKRIF
jgi:hypothetical protein